MKRPKTYSEVIQIEQDGLLVRGWRKKCVCCGGSFETTSRGQKFCSSECAKKAQKRKRKQQKEYDLNKEFVRLSARSHAIAVEVLKLLEREVGKLHECELCGDVDNLQVHHKNQKWLDNSPENLQWLCPKCHSKVHADLAKEMQSTGKTYVDLYSKSEYILYGRLLKSD